MILYNVYQCGTTSRMLHEQTKRLQGYPFSPGHYVISITYRESLMALPGQGQRIDLR